MHCETAGRTDAHRLNPPRFCNAFNESGACLRHFTPRGLCEWDAAKGLCVTSTTCSRRISSPTGTSYFFFKFHKVGSSTVGGTLRLALISATGNVFASCLRVAKLRNKTEVERARYHLCSLCAKHDNSLPLLPFFRTPAVLAATPERRLHALFSRPDAAAVLDDRCPQRASMHNVLRTGTIFRRPVDRIISKYYFLRTYCEDKMRRLGRQSCVALDLDLVPWLYSGLHGDDGHVSTAARTVVGEADWQATHEILAYLGDFNSTETSLRRAQRTIDAIDVVGITERMEETMVLFSERWQLPLEAVRQSYVSLLVNPSKRPVNQSQRAAIEAHPAVRMETRLYEYALRKFEREVQTVEGLTAKVASIRKAAYACTLQGGCSVVHMPDDDE